MYPCATTLLLQCSNVLNFHSAHIWQIVTTAALYHCNIMKSIHATHAMRTTCATNKQESNKTNANEYGNICCKYLKALMPFANMMEHSQASTISF